MEIKGMVTEARQIRPIKFANDAHKMFYEKHVAETNSHRDPERKALFYALGLTSETRRNIKSLYNFSEQCIEWDGLKEGFQTGVSLKVCRLAFNLFNGLHGQQGKDERAKNYTPYGLFDTDLREYMFEAIRIRYSN